MKKIILSLIIITSFSTNASEFMIGKFSDENVTKKEKVAINNIINNTADKSDFKLISQIIRNLRFIENQSLSIDLSKLEVHILNNLSSKAARTGGESGSGGGGG